MNALFCSGLASAQPNQRCGIGSQTAYHRFTDVSENQNAVMRSCTPALIIYLFTCTLLIDHSYIDATLDLVLRRSIGPGGTAYELPSVLEDRSRTIALEEPRGSYRGRMSQVSSAFILPFFLQCILIYHNGRPIPPFSAFSMSLIAPTGDHAFLITSPLRSFHSPLTVRRSDEFLVLFPITPERYKACPSVPGGLWALGRLIAARGGHCSCGDTAQP